MALTPPADLRQSFFVEDAPAIVFQTTGQAFKHQWIRIGKTLNKAIFSNLTDCWWLMNLKRPEKLWSDSLNCPPIQLKIECVSR
jgi:hypothetical protein